MAERVWEVSKVRFCEHVRQEVALESEVLYPIDFLPDAPRILSHRCSLGLECNQSARANCVWSGTNPGYDPFRA